MWLFKEIIKEVLDESIIAEFPKSLMWDEEACRKVAEQCTSKKEFKEKNYSAYCSAYKHGWLKDYTWFERPKRISKKEPKWTYELCRQEAEKYETKEQFRYGSYMAYRVSLANGWMKDFDWLRKKAIWTREACFNEAMKYKTKRDFYTKSYGAYATAKKNHWLKDYNWLYSMKKRWSYEDCYNEAKKYQTYQDFSIASPKCCEKARKMGWIKDYYWLEGKYKWNQDTCYAEAKKYTTKGEFKEKSPLAYFCAAKNGWLEEYDWLGNVHKWTRQACYDEAKKYRTTGDFLRGSSTAYSVARKNGWLKDYDWMIVTKQGKPRGLYALRNNTEDFSNPQQKWTKERCYFEAKKYRTKSAFAKKSPGAYSKAFSRKWINDYSWLK